MVSEQLGDVLHVRSFTATCAGAAELEQRLGKLGVLHVGLLVHVLLVAYILVKVVEAGLVVVVGDVRNHLESLFGLGEAHIHAVAATGAVVYGDCKGVLVVLEVGLALGEFHACGNLCGLLLGEEERADCGVRANECAVVALDTFFGIPGGNVNGHSALFKGGGAVGHGAVCVRQEGAYGEGVTGLCVHDVGDVLHECRSKTVLIGVLELGGNFGPLCGNLDFGVLTAAVYGSVVHVHHVFTLLAIGLHNCVLHVLHGVFGGDDAGDAEECALEDGVGAASKADFGGNLGGVDDVHLDVLAADGGFNVVRNVLDGLFFVPEGVEKEGAAFLDALQDIVFLKVGGDVAGHEVRGVHKVRGLDGAYAEAEVRAGVAAGFLGVVVEVGLAVEVRVRADDLDGVLVGADGTVRTKAVELALCGAGLHDGYL